METKVLVESLGLWSLGFIEIDNIPLLSGRSVVTPYSNSLSFLIFASSDIKGFAVLPIDELVILILENLEPSRVSAPDLHVISSSSTLDIPRLIVVSCSDGQRWLMEVPDLGLSSIGSLKDHVSIVDQIHVSSTW
jgi:hypothetical protein